MAGAAAAAAQPSQPVGAVDQKHQPAAPLPAAAVVADLTFIQRLWRDYPALKTRKDRIAHLRKHIPDLPSRFDAERVLDQLTGDESYVEFTAPRRSGTTAFLSALARAIRILKPTASIAVWTPEGSRTVKERFAGCKWANFYQRGGPSCDVLICEASQFLTPEQWELVRGNALRLVICSRIAGQTPVDQKHQHAHAAVDDAASDAALHTEAIAQMIGAMRLTVKVGGSFAVRSGDWVEWPRPDAVHAVAKS